MVGDIVNDERADGELAGAPILSGDKLGGARAERGSRHKAGRDYWAI